MVAVELQHSSLDSIGILPSDDEPSRSVGLPVTGPLCQRATGQKQRSPVPKGGNEFSGRWTRGPRSGSFSTPVLSFNLAAHLHHRVLTRDRRSKRFPELFTGQLVNFVPLLFISAVIDSTIHFFRFLCTTLRLCVPLSDVCSRWH